MSFSINSTTVRFLFGGSWMLLGSGSLLKDAGEFHLFPNEMRVIPRADFSSYCWLAGTKGIYSQNIGVGFRVYTSYRIPMYYNYPYSLLATRKFHAS